MAIRVRKLAKEMGRGAWDVIGILHALGSEKYRSEDDMLPDDMAEMVKRAARQGVVPVDVPRPVVAPKAAPARDASADFMAKLIPGIIPLGGEPPPKAPPRPAPPSDRAAAVRAEIANEARSSAAAAPRPDDGLGPLRAAVEAERAALLAERSLVAAERAALLAERAAFARERHAAPAAAPEETSSPIAGSLADQLVARGLRGSDELDRALISLAQARLLGDLAARVRADDPAAIDRLLRERMILVGGTVPDGLNAAAVTVSPDRAEVPDAADLGRRIGRLGEQLLLHGLRRVLVAGGRPIGQRLLKGVDPRVEIRFVPAQRRTRAEAEVDVTRTDAVVLWGIDADADALQVYATSRAVLVRVPTPDVVAFLDGITASLR